MDAQHKAVVHLMELVARCIEITPTRHELPRGNESAYFLREFVPHIEANSPHHILSNSVGYFVPRFLPVINVV
jgi:hypothetical protein